MKIIKEWVLDNYEPETIKDITNHGMVHEFAGLSTYTA